MIEIFEFTLTCKPNNSFCMKNITKLLIFLAIFICSTCNENEDDLPIYVEVNLNSPVPIAEISSQRILFSYFLSDEEGTAKTKFNQGENFVFNFAIKNEDDKYLCIVNDFLLNKSLCAVKNDKILILSPFEFLGREKIGSAAHQLLPGNEYQLKVPWSDPRDKWTSLHCEFTSNHRDLLPKGDYYTSFSQTFCFDRADGNGSFCTVNITFKINFQII